MTADGEAIPISLTFFLLPTYFDCVLCADSRIMSIAPYRAQITSFRIGKFFPWELAVDHAPLLVEGV